MLRLALLCGCARAVRVDVSGDLEFASDSVTSDAQLNRTYAQKNLMAPFAEAPPPVTRKPTLPMNWRTKLTLEGEKPLGVGGFGQVWRASVRCPGQDAVANDDLSLAVKFCTMPCDESEFELMEILDSHGLVKGFTHYGGHFSSMELLGPDLFETLFAKGAPRLAPALQAQYVADVLDGLVHIHGAGLVHRDIKLENVFVTLDGLHAKLGDFGLLCCRAKGYFEKWTRKSSCMYKGASIGTPCTGFAGTMTYISPDYFRRGTSVFGTGQPGPRDDLWSLGMVVYMMLRRRMPPAFKGQLTEEVLEKVQGHIMHVPSTDASSKELLLYHLLCSGDRCKPYKQRPFTTQDALDLALDWLDDASGGLPEPAAAPVATERTRKCLQ